MLSMFSRGNGIPSRVFYTAERRTVALILISSKLEKYSSLVKLYESTSSYQPKNSQA